MTSLQEDGFDFDVDMDVEPAQAVQEQEAEQDELDIVDDMNVDDLECLADPAPEDLADLPQDSQAGATANLQQPPPATVSLDPSQYAPSLQDPSVLQQLIVSAFPPDSGIRELLFNVSQSGPYTHEMVNEALKELLVCPRTVQGLARVPGLPHVDDL